MKKIVRKYYVVGSFSFNFIKSEENDFVLRISRL